MHLPLRHIIAMIAVVCALGVSAQRRVTPVTSTNPAATVVKSKEVKPMDRTNVVERTDSKGNVILVDTLTGSEFVDTTVVVKLPQYVYPKLNGVTVGVNIFDPFMRLLGQEYGGIDFWGELSIYNRFFPTFVIGAGQADITPDGNNFTFKSPVAPYFKLGCRYNMFYNNNPAYQFLVGLMYGFSPFSYEVTDVTVDEGYWQDPSHFTIPSRSTTAGWLEITFGIKVKIVNNLSLGWSFNYHTILHEGKSTVGYPMYIPGYGKRSNALTAGFSVMYSIPWPRLKPSLNPQAEAMSSETNAGSEL